MFCSNCGNKLNGNETYCSECGAPVQVQKTLTDKLSEKITPWIKKIKDFIKKHKKSFGIGSGGLVAVITFIVLFNTFYDFTKLSWDEENSDAYLEYTVGSKLTLKVLAYDKDKNPITEIKFVTKDGSIESEKTTVVWTLPEMTGEYKITAQAPSGKKITKKVKVVDLDENGSSKYLAGVYQEEEDENADSDSDGLTNGEEKKLGTSSILADTDKDGLTDYYEVNNSKTDPLKSDSDSDGVYDGDELDLDLNPLKVDSKDDGISDGNRSLVYNINDNNSGVSLEINGKGNIASTTIDLLENSTFANMDGLIGKIYNFYSSGTIETAKVEIKYDLNDIREKKLNEDNLTVYYFNEKTKKLEAVPTIIDKENKILSVTLKHFSNYVIGDSNLVKTTIESEIMFVIDNSISMYSENQMIQAGYDNSNGAIGNDINFKRLTLTNKLIDMITGEYKFGVSEFSGNYVNLKKFTTDKDSIKEAVSSMRSNWHSNANGTNIVSALENGITEFNDNGNNQYLILFTDGKNTKGSLYSNKNKIISAAKEKKINICVIGLGSEIDSDILDEVAESTGCDYYNASDSSALDEIYARIGATINYNLVDTDGDNVVDGMIVADSGFLVNRDGFSFNNFISSRSDGGHCYGMATFAMLYYKKQLPLSLGPEDKTNWMPKTWSGLFKSNGYNLENTYFSNYKTLYNYEFEDEGVRLLMSDDIPSDYRDRVEDNTWMIKKDYYELLNKIGAKISIKKYTGKDKQDFTKYQSALLTIDDEIFNNAVKKDDAQILNAIWRLFILQVGDKRESFSSEPDNAFKTLNEELNDGNPIVSSINGSHAINSIRLIQDINDSNKFKIEVYDNNFAGETRYIEVSRSKFNKFSLDYVAWTNEYQYEFKYDKDGDGDLDTISFGFSFPVIN